MSTPLEPCPICGAPPVRNGRGRVGGVKCNGATRGTDRSHLVQAYGADQDEADRAWNIRATTAARVMVSGDLFHRSPHTFDDAAWGGGRDDCKRCGIFLNSFYDDEDGCHGPWWMRCQDGGGRAE